MSETLNKKIINQTKTEQIKIPENQLQKQFDIYKAKMESLLISQLELIKDINKED